MLCVIAKIDEPATAALQALQSAALRQGAVPRHIHGHITLVSYIGEDESGYLAYCREVLRDAEAFGVVYDSLAVLAETNIIVAQPSESEPLRSLHCRLGHGCWKSLDHWSQKAVWKPHTTLVHGPNLDLEQLCYRLRESFTPVAAQVAQIEFSRVTDCGYEIVDCMDLKDS